MSEGIKVMKILLSLCLAFASLPAVVKGDEDTAAPVDKIVFIYLSSSSEEFMKKFATQEGTVPKEKKQEAVDELKKMAQDSQKEVVQAIEGHTKKYHYESYWVVNMIALNESDSDLMEKITEMKSVRSVELVDRPVYDLTEQNADSEASFKARASDAQWNIKQLNVPEVWNSGINGSGVVVGTLQRGAWGGNTLILPRYRGDGQYGFYEPATMGAGGGNTLGCLHEHDTTRVSTFRVGLAVGINGYGVAPGATFMACSSVFVPQRYLDCVAWFICPHRGGTGPGDDPDCSKSPAAVVVASEFQTLSITQNMEMGAINMLIAMGIIVITEAGRIDGNPCRRVNFACTIPATICVGFTNQDGKRSKYSACGPGPGNSTKPDFLVPGYGVESADSCENACFDPATSRPCTWTDAGATSGSGHALGVVALMLQKNPGLTQARAKQILIESSKQVEDEEFQCCGDLEQKHHPNYCSGYGLLDAKKAVDSS